MRQKKTLDPRRPTAQSHNCALVTFGPKRQHAFGQRRRGGVLRYRRERVRLALPTRGDEISRPGQYKVDPKTEKANGADGPLQERRLGPRELAQPDRERR